MGKFWKMLLVLSTILFALFTGLFIREKNIAIKLTDQVVEQSKNVTPPDSPPSPTVSQKKENDIVIKSDNDKVVQYEIAAAISLIMLIISGLGMKITTANKGGRR
ncbi:hypothetical protein PTHTG4_31610 [Parageobacillus thermoglucosidasius]|uniref:hypothetical protein n=1 Tax=Parageobacillus thermoglucosidasius TaxID=1426 RepID=UPI000F626BB1|nr:hypothetical protein [Parageobacillus thermoglucosidasius]GCD84096.1 hypothetical protein PTHTG4_31610 [Parageobacillus thermoglucosidasius]